LSRDPKIFPLKLDPTCRTFIGPVFRRQHKFIPIDPSPADMVKASSRVLGVQRVVFVQQHHSYRLSYFPRLIGAQSVMMAIDEPAGG
jgi:hypothetical protein